MITLIVFVYLFVIYVTVFFFRGVYHEKKDRKQKKPEDPQTEKVIT